LNIGKFLEKVDFFMDFWMTYLNRWLIPLFLTSLTFYFHFKKDEIRKKIEKFKNITRRDFCLNLLDGFALRFDDWRYTLFVPILAAVALDLLVSWAFQLPLRSMGEPLITALTTSGFLNAVGEEFLVRGLLLGMFLAFLLTLRKKSKFHFLKKPVQISESTYHTASIILVVLTGLVFSISHGNFTFYQFAIRFVNGVLFGVLYLLAGRNLLPAIVAHGAGNWLLILIDNPHF